MGFAAPSRSRTVSKWWKKHLLMKRFVYILDKLFDGKKFDIFEYEGIVCCVTKNKTEHQIEMKNLKIDK